MGTWFWLNIPFALFVRLLLGRDPDVALAHPLGTPRSRITPGQPLTKPRGQHTGVPPDLRG